MALYKYAEFFQQSNHQAFDLLHNPGALTPHSGVYRCHGCGQETAEVMGRPLPLEDHHQHTRAQGQIQWQLVVTHN